MSRILSPCAREKHDAGSVQLPRILPDHTHQGVQCVHGRRGLARYSLPQSNFTKYLDSGEGPSELVAGWPFLSLHHTVCMMGIGSQVGVGCVYVDVET